MAVNWANPHGQASLNPGGIKERHRKRALGKRARRVVDIEVRLLTRVDHHRSPFRRRATGWQARARGRSCCAVSKTTPEASNRLVGSGRECAIWPPGCRNAAPTRGFRISRGLRLESVLSSKKGFGGSRVRGRVVLAVCYSQTALKSAHGRSCRCIRELCVDAGNAAPTRGFRISRGLRLESFMGGLIPKKGRDPPSQNTARRRLTRGPAGHVELGWWSTRAWDGRTDRWSRARHLCHQPARRSGPWNSVVVSRCRHIGGCRGLDIILFLNLRYAPAQHH